MKDKEKMLKGDLYIASSEELKKDNLRARKFMHEYNIVAGIDDDYRKELVRNLFEKTGTNFKITSPFYCDYGIHITIGENFYANFGCIFLDVKKIIMGDNVMFGPRVGLYTASHPTDPQVRIEGYEYGLPIIIEDNVWLGGDVIVNPGVTIGANSIVASGSVVTKDIPKNVIAAGVPAKVIREINENDKRVWEAKKQQYHQE